MSLGAGPGSEDEEGSEAVPFPCSGGLDDDRRDGGEAFNLRPSLLRQKIQKTGIFQRGKGGDLARRGDGGGGEERRGARVRAERGRGVDKGEREQVGGDREVGAWSSCSACFRRGHGNDDLPLGPAGQRERARAGPNGCAARCARGW